MMGLAAIFRVNVPTEPVFLKVQQKTGRPAMTAIFAHLMISARQESALQVPSRKMRNAKVKSHRAACVQETAGISFPLMLAPEKRSVVAMKPAFNMAIAAKASASTALNYPTASKAPTATRGKRRHATPVFVIQYSGLEMVFVMPDSIAKNSITMTETARTRVSVEKEKCLHAAVSPVGMKVMSAMDHAIVF